MNAAEQKAGSMGKYVVIYVAILGLAALQFVIAHEAISPSQMLVRMLLIAIFQAALGLLYFMHLGQERGSLALFVLVITVFVLLAMQYGWTDSFRLLSGVPWAK